MALTGRFWFRKTWTGKLVLVVEDERPRWFGRRGTTKARWRDAAMLDFAEPAMRALMQLESGPHADRRPARGLHVVATALPKSAAA